MAVRQEAPIHKGPGLSIPEVKIKKRKHKAGKIIGSAILAGSLGFVALGGYEIYSNNQKNNPEPTPIAGGIGEPTPSITPEATIFVSPSPEITQSPTPEPSPTPDTRPWYQQLPENPYQGVDVNKIPLAEWFGRPIEGSLNMEPLPFKPYYAVRINAATIIVVKPDIENNNVWMELATAKPGVKIKKESCKLTNVNGKADVNMCSYSGPTLWLKINNKTFVYNRSGSERYGQGLETAVKYLKVGDVITSDFLLGIPPDDLLNQTEINRNIKSWMNIKNSVGKSIPRTTEPNINFSFIPGDIFVY